MLNSNSGTACFFGHPEILGVIHKLLIFRRRDSGHIHDSRIYSRHKRLWHKRGKKGLSSANYGPSAARSGI